ncbi:MAG: HlyC/CorC family transporter [Spirochaetes bacterium]|nr:HlyC/CorC family transporter [Spirochaetota bacterium]
MMLMILQFQLYLFLIFVMIMLSFFFSGSETAILTSRRYRLETLSQTGNRSAARSLRILDNFEDAVGMILLGNNIVNIAAAAFVTYIATSAFMLNEPGLLALTAVQTVVFLVVCEVTPKVVARARAETFLMICSYPLLALMTVMRPAVKVSLIFSNALKSRLGITSTEQRGIRSREEINILFKMGQELGVINEEHQAYVSEILSFRGIVAREIMTPTIDIVSVEINQPVRELTDIIVRTRFSRIPVYERRVDNIVGYVFYRELLKNRNAKRIADVMNRAYYVPATKRIVEIYAEMVENLIPAVFVVNEQGGVVGMVTHEDIAEEVVGEIQTRDQSEEDLVAELGRERFAVSGRMDIEYFMKRFNVVIEKKGFETLAGFVSYRMGKIPKKGDRFYHDRYAFIIDEATERSIERVIVQKRKKKKVSEQP